MTSHVVRAAYLSMTVALFVSVLSACGGGGSSPESTGSEITPLVNLPPQTVADQFQANLNQTLTISVASILVNDTDPECRLVTLQRVAPFSRAGGTVARLGDVIEYTPPLNYLGEDEFSYIVVDAESSVAEGVVIIQVRVPNAPLAQSDVLTTQEDQASTIAVADLLLNDLASSSGALMLVGVTSSSDTHGTIALDGGVVNYEPARDYFGIANFSYTVSDGVQTSTATVSVLINPVNDAPSAKSDVAESQTDVPVEIAIIENDTDVDGDAVMILSVDATSAKGGSVRLGSNGLVMFIPGLQVGRDTFQYSIVDGSGATSTAVVSIDVLAAVSFNEAAYAFVDHVLTTNEASAEQALDDIIAVTGNGWLADRSGSRFSIHFDRAKLIHKVVLTGNTGSADFIREASIVFNDGSLIPVGSVSSAGDPKVLYFTPRLVTGLDIIVSDVSGPAAGLNEVAAFTALIGQRIQAQEQFHDPAVPGWTQGAEFDVTGNPPAWAITGDVYQQTVRSLAQSDDATQLGVYTVWEPIHEALDLRLRVRVDRLDKFEPGVTGILFGYQDNDNYYRFTMSRHSSYHRLEKKVAGTFTELASGTAGLPVGEWINIRAVVDQSVIVIQINGQFALGAMDATFSNGKMGLWNNWVASASYDKLSLLTAPPEGVIGVAVPSPLAVFGAGILSVRGISTQPLSGIEFVVDEGLPTEQLQKSLVDPFSVTFNYDSPGSHFVKLYALDSAGVRKTGPDQLATLDSVGVLGKYVVGVGDSITNGVFDDVLSDDVSLNGRNITGGYQPILNNRLTSSLTVPVTVMDESNPGDKAADGAKKINRIASKHAQADAFLIMYGTNDTEAASAGGDLTPIIADYKTKMREIVMATLVRAPNANVFLAQIPPLIGRGARTNLARSFNTEIRNLVTEFAVSNPGRVFLGPDYFGHFNSNQTELDSDGIHPNGMGYQSMGSLWFDALIGKI